MERDKRIDVLRCLGTFLVIMAHAGFPPIVQNIRTFDVVLLVYVSGISASVSNPLKNGYGKYIRKRMIKLLLPTYFVIVGTFLSVNLLCLALGRSQVYSTNGLLYSLLLFNEGIGYVWFIKIYLICAALLPLLMTISKRLSTRKIFCLIVSLLGVYVAMYSCYMHSSLGDLSNPYKMIIEEYLLGVFAYVLVYLLGIKTGKEHSSNRLTVVIFAVLFALAQILKGLSFCPNENKYPPGLYYISYGVFVSALLFYAIPKKTNPFVTWISKNSFYVYIFHIPFAAFSNMITNSLVKVVIMLLGGILCTVIWLRIKEKFKDRTIMSYL